MGQNQINNVKSLKQSWNVWIKERKREGSSWSSTIIQYLFNI